MSDRTKHPGGRPLSGEHALAVDIKVRIDAPTNERLTAYCERNQTNRAAAIRQSILRELDRDECENQ